MNEPQVGEVWTHYKGNRYTIKDIAVIEENMIDCAIYYRSDGSDHTLWVRPLHDFTTNVFDEDGKVVPRFTLTEEAI